jgi:signal transduction histidine kinase
MGARQNLSAKQVRRYNLEREALKSLASQAALRADVGSALASAMDLRRILQKCAEAIVKHVEAAFARVWLLNDDQGVLELQASAGMYTRINGTYSRIALRKLEIGHVAWKKTKHLNNDIVHHSRIDDKKWAKREGLVAFAGYPLVIGKRVIGVVGMFFKHSITRAILDTLGSVADAIAQGIERIRAEDGLRQLSGQLLRSQDEERRRIAYDLHNVTGQNLVTLLTSLDQLRRALPSSRNWRKLIIHCEKVVQQCLTEVRTLSYLLHPPMLDKFGLEDAIREYLEGFGERSGIRFRVRVPPNLGRFNREAELVLFRVVQESLTNVRRHSRSKWAEIRIERHEKKVVLEVRDKGPAITTQRSDRAHPAGVGIASLQERTRHIGGRLDIEFRKVGTLVRAIVPT